MTVFERNDRLVCDAFRDGEFDSIEAAGEVSETDFFRAIAGKKILEKLAGSYPTPLKKHDVPVWVYIASNVAMRFHGVHQFHAYPYVVRSGGMVQAFGPQMGHRAIHPETGDVTLECGGFNDKNSYDRQTPCDQDYLRKMARKTDADRLQDWFNRDVVGIFRQHRAFDREGLFIGDATYLFLPDNPAYEHASLMLFNEHNKPVDGLKLTSKQKLRCQWRRCYKLVTLIHTNRAGDFFLWAGLRVSQGKDNDLPILYRMVDEFVAYHGTGIIKRLILDRGFLDGPSIGRCKQDYGIDILIPARRNMEITRDAIDLADAQPGTFQSWTPPAPPEKPAPLHRPAAIRKREQARQRTLEKRPVENPPDPATTRVGSELAVVRDLESYSNCPVPLHAVINRERYADGHTDQWVLLDTKRIADPAQTRTEYALRTVVEERYRQTKCFSGLAEFSSRAFSLVVNQVVFVLLTYSLLQWYLRRIERRNMNRSDSPPHPRCAPADLYRHSDLLPKLRRLPLSARASGNGAHTQRNGSQEDSCQDPPAPSRPGKSTAESSASIAHRALVMDFYRPCLPHHPAVVALVSLLEPHPSLSPSCNSLFPTQNSYRPKNHTISIG